jgi:hypothetical protein
VLSPEEFAARVTALSGSGLDVEILDQKRLTEIGMNALLAVGFARSTDGFAPHPGFAPILPGKMGTSKWRFQLGWQPSS